MTDANNTSGDGGTPPSNATSAAEAGGDGISTTSPGSSAATQDGTPTPASGSTGDAGAEKVEKKPTTKKKPPPRKAKGKTGEKKAKEPVTPKESTALIFVGGRSCKIGLEAVKNMTGIHSKNIAVIFTNTDRAALKEDQISCERILGKKGIILKTHFILLGEKFLKGEGTGTLMLLGRMAVAESEPELKRLLHGYKMVFVVAGLGKGTGSGSAPEIARIAKATSEKVKVFGVPIMPEKRNGQDDVATAGRARLYESCHVLIDMPGINDDEAEAKGDNQGEQPEEGSADEKLYGHKNETVAEDLVDALTGLVITGGEQGTDINDLRTALGDTIDEQGNPLYKKEPCFGAILMARHTPENNNKRPVQTTYNKLSEKGAIHMPEGKSVESALVHISGPRKLLMEKDINAVFESVADLLKERKGHRNCPIERTGRSFFSKISYTDPEENEMAESLEGITESGIKALTSESSKDLSLTCPAPDMDTKNAYSKEITITLFAIGTQNPYETVGETLDAAVAEEKTATPINPFGIVASPSNNESSSPVSPEENLLTMDFGGTGKTAQRPYSRPGSNGTTSTSRKKGLFAGWGGKKDK